MLTRGMTLKDGNLASKIRLDDIARMRYFRRVDIEHEAFYLGIAEQVITQRGVRNLSQKELAAITGTTQSAIARFEAGKRPPKLDTLLRIAKALDCDLDITFRPKTSIRRETS